MALQTRTIKSKIQAVGNIKKITRAMELVSVSKMKKATEAALSTRPYANKALEILVNISRQRALKHPLFVHGNDKRNLVVIVSSNKGLCGNYNTNVFKAVKTFISRVQNKHEAEIDFITVGKRSEKIAQKMGGTIVASFIDLPEEVRLDSVSPLVRVVREEFESGKYYNVVVIYTNYISALSNEALARQVLPVKVENVINMIDESGKTIPGSHEPSSDFSNYIFEPDEEEVVDQALKSLTEIQIFQTVLESRASEHSARMMAMKNATENADRLRDDLVLSFNRARQAGITREISEISSGAEALNG